MTPAELPAAFYDYVVGAAGPDGFRLAPGWILGADGKLSVLAMDLKPDQIYPTVMMMASNERAAAFVFAIDRFAKPGQGTTRSDVLAGHISTKGLRGMRPFIVEYDSATGAAGPLTYDNVFWNRALMQEFTGSFPMLAYPETVQ